MKISVLNIEPKVENVAYMRISNYHKFKGDHVEWYDKNKHEKYDIIYVSSLFSFTEKPVKTDNMICGGTGYDLITKLPIEIEESDLDYSIYPECNRSYVWFSRGCTRACPYCVVNQKEGRIHTVSPFNLNPKGEFISIQDNNFFNSPGWKDAIEQLKNWGQPVEFNGGIDARTLTEEQCYALKELRHFKQIKIAWDNPKEDLTGKLKEIIKIISKYKLMCYVLVGYWSTPEEDMFRIMTLKNLGIDPFVMPYDKKNRYQMDLARWCNRKMIFRKTSFEDYVRHGNIFKHNI